MSGKTISHFEIIEPLGGGAMGRVYRALDTRLNRPIALKVLPLGMADDPVACQRFLREAQAASSLDHPNICTVHHIGKTPDGQMFMALAWYEGRTLKELLREGGLGAERGLKYAHQIVAGLACAHEKGIIHRDIKPANLIVTEHDEVKIVDFGLAHLVGRERLTTQGSIVGTAAYMSPEQARGEEVGQASDIWSVGIVLYEMLCGRLPFQGDTDMAMLYSVLNQDPTPLPEGTCRDRHACQAVIDGCLVRKAEDRYPDAEALGADLELALYRENPSNASRIWDSKIVFAGKGGMGRWLAPVLVGLILVSLWFLPPFRQYIRTAMGHGGTSPPAGVAVLPFRITGPDSGASAFGVGLSQNLLEELTAADHQTTRFWLVPWSEVRVDRITDRQSALTVLGISRTVSATGQLSGSRLTLKLAYQDGNSGTLVTREFKDDLANLHTWQTGLLTWTLEQMDGSLAERIASANLHTCTTIPLAFQANLEGWGHLNRSHGGRDSLAIARARSRFNAAIAADSSYARAWTGSGTALYLAARHHDKSLLGPAEARLLVAARLDSGSVWPWYYLGALKEHQGRPDSAETYFRLALERDPIHSQTLQALASLEHRRGRIAAAEAYLLEAVRARPNFARANTNAGTFFYYLGRYDQAEKYFRSLVNLTPYSRRGYTMLGAVYFETERYGEAEDMFESSLAIEPSFQAYSNLGTLFYYQGRFGDAAAMCRKALALDDSQYYVWSNLACACKWAPGLRDTARVAFTRALELAEPALRRTPRDPWLIADVASFYAELGDGERARNLLARLDEPHDLETEIAFSVASTWEILGERNKALDWLEVGVGKDLSLGKVARYPELRNLRAHPRFQKLLARYEP